MSHTLLAHGFFGPKTNSVRGFEIRFYYAQSWQKIGKTYLEIKQKITIKIKEFLNKLLSFPLIFRSSEISD